MKMKSIAICLIFTLLFVGGLLITNLRKSTVSIGEFEIDEYQYYIEEFSFDQCVNPICGTEDLLKKVEEIWLAQYGKNIKNQKPYQVFYDKKNKIWLVQGTLSSDNDGGVANILIENDTGNILAVWHDK